MDQNGLEILRDHLDFMKWVLGGCAGGLVMAAGIVYRTILQPMRDAYADSLHADRMIMTRLADAMDSTKMHIQSIPCMAARGSTPPPQNRPTPKISHHG
jgi:hypothetical protein